MDDEKMTTQNSYSLTNRQHLVDLNGEMTNFNLTFTVTSKNNESFDVLVVDQTTLDNQPKLDFKRANGTISGNIIADKNVYQNYFLCLKADKPCDVTVTIDLKEIPPQLPPPQQPAQPAQSMATGQAKPQQLVKAKKSEGINWKFVLIVIIVVGGGALLWYMYNRKETKNKPQTTQEISDTQPSVENVPVPTPPTLSPQPEVAEPSVEVTPAKPPVAPVMSQGSSFMSSATRSSLIDRLNSLPLK